MKREVILVDYDDDTPHPNPVSAKAKKVSLSKEQRLPDIAASKDAMTIT